MEIPNKNQQDILPYEKLALLGIDREKADSLPQDVRHKLSSGEVTPLLEVSINTGNGTVITLPSNSSSPQIRTAILRLSHTRCNAICRLTGTMC